MDNILLELSPRQSGKTTRMIEWLKGNSNRILLTYNEAEAIRLRRENKDLVSQFMSWGDYMSKQKQLSRDHEVSIDNMECIIRIMVNHPIVRMSMSVGDGVVVEKHEK